MDSGHRDQRHPTGKTQLDDPRDLPSNDEAEQALLGAILANNHAYDVVADFLRAQHFFDGIHARIYAAATQLIERGITADAIQLKNLFEHEGALEEVGGAQYLAQLQANYVTVINAADYGRTIHDLFLRREMIALSREIYDRAYDYEAEEGAAGGIEATEARLYSLAETGQREAGLQPFSMSAMAMLSRAELAMAGEGLSGLSTGLKDLDRLLGGLRRSNLIILAARPSMGKSALAGSIALAVATRQLQAAEAGQEPQGAVAFFSLEMSAEEFSGRLISAQSGIASSAMMRGTISHEDLERLRASHSALHKLPLHIDESGGLSVAQIRARARRLKRKQALSLIVVDYLQLMSQPGMKQSDNRVQEVSQITRGLKQLAKELDVPVIALSQLNRALETREDKRPQLSDLRESGSIEQDADVVIFIYRESYYAERAEPQPRDGEAESAYAERQQAWLRRLDAVRGKADIIIAKQRHGPIGTVELAFNGDLICFSDLSRDDALPAH